MVHVDNAKEFHSEALIRWCQEYGIQLEPSAAGAATVTAVHIERLIGAKAAASATRAGDGSPTLLGKATARAFRTFIDDMVQILVDILRNHILNWMT